MGSQGLGFGLGFGFSVLGFVQLNLAKLAGKNKV